MQLLIAFCQKDYSYILGGNNFSVWIYWCESLSHFSASNAHW